MPGEFAQSLGLLLLVLRIAGALGEPSHDFIKRGVLAGLRNLRWIRKLIGRWHRGGLRARLLTLACVSLRLLMLALLLAWFLAWFLALLLLLLFGSLLSSWLAGGIRGRLRLRRFGLRGGACRIGR